MLNKFKIYTFFIILILSVGCSADSSESLNEIQAVKNKLNEILPEEIELLSVQETDMTGFFEVNFEGIEPLYVSSDGNYLVSGDIYLITKEGLVNKSEARRDYQRKTLINNLDTKELITFEPENYIHSIFVFTDVDCGYCRQFHNQIDSYLELGIKVNYLAYPRAGIGSESFKKITSAWCNEDANYSLTMLKQGKEIETNICADNPVEKHFNLGNIIGVQGTPSIVTDEGKMIPGYLPPQDLLNILTTNS
jgi:thiol:disulfide interchange protein DsbC